MKYKENIDRARNETLNELVAQAQELNMGYEYLCQISPSPA
jgi:uncharacterized protein YbjQ (UPF0145 family)